MKKLTFLALSLMALSFSACDSGTDEPIAKAEVVATATYSISGTVTGASSATVSLYKGSTLVKTATTTTGAFNFPSLEKTAYTVKVTSTGYVEQSVDVTLSDNNADAIVTAALVKASTETKAVTEVVNQTAAVTVTNDAASEASTNTTAAIEVPASTTITNASEVTATTFSVTPYVPASTTTDAAVTTGTTTETAPVIALSCEPSGAKFDKPVTLAIDLGESDIDASYLKLVNGTESKTVSLSGTTYSGQVDHFSTWTFELNPTITTSDEQNTTSSKSVSLTSGSHAIAYNSLAGYEITTNNLSASKILKAFIQTHFGAAVKTISKSATADVTGTGTLTYDVVQKYKTSTIKLGTKVVAVIKIYTGATFGNTNFQAATTDHSGGSGK